LRALSILALLPFYSAAG